MNKKLFNNIFIVIFLSFVFISSTYQIFITTANTNHNGYTIVLDAGHGGRDGGCIGTKGTIEKEINLTYTLALKDKLSHNNYKVVLTRATDDGLYSTSSKNKKNSDMLARYNIINKSNPNLVISIHMNSFPSQKARGACTYYRKDDYASKQCADLIQKSLYANCFSQYDSSKIGDYYLLNCTYYSAVLIECGFLSNPEEEKLLNTKDYMNKLIDAIYDGILLYLG